jgi:hypothetical protein
MRFFIPRRFAANSGEALHQWAGAEKRDATAANAWVYNQTGVDQSIQYYDRMVDFFTRVQTAVGADIQAGSEHTARIYSTASLDSILLQTSFLLHLSRFG